MNVDAVLQNKVGRRVIIRNSTGQVVAAFFKTLIGRYRPQEMEAKVLLSGLDWASHHNFLDAL
ncbi:hypothetical protein CsatB_019615 [Cannabis sativa]